MVESSPTSETMIMEEESGVLMAAHANYGSDGSSEEDELLIKELLDYNNINNNTNNFSFENTTNSAAINSFISNIYSGPTISDIENALSLTNHSQHYSHDHLSLARYVYI